MNEKNEKILGALASAASIGLALYKAYKASTENTGTNANMAKVELYPAQQESRPAGPKVDPNILLNMGIRYMGRMTDITNNGFN